MYCSTSWHIHQSAQSAKENAHRAASKVEVHDHGFTRAFFVGLFPTHLRDLGSCGITDDDVEAGHLGACFDAAGRTEITQL